MRSSGTPTRNDRALLPCIACIGEVPLGPASQPWPPNPWRQCPPPILPATLLQPGGAATPGFLVSGSDAMTWGDEPRLGPERHGVLAGFLQRDACSPTGTVSVDSGCPASFGRSASVARVARGPFWTATPPGLLHRPVSAEASQCLNLAAQRSPGSRHAIKTSPLQEVPRSQLRLCDINRDPFHARSDRICERPMHRKLNETELPMLARDFRPALGTADRRRDPGGRFHWNPVLLTSAPPEAVFGAMDAGGGTGSPMSPQGIHRGCWGLLLPRHSSWRAF